MNPRVTLYEQGMTLGKPGNNKGNAGKRSIVGGWSQSTTRRHVKFLRSIRVSDLTGMGFSYTLTVRDCPPTPDAWLKIREAYFKRLNRLGSLRIHWLTEWQRRGVPHLHGSVYFQDEGIPLGNMYISSPVEICTLLTDQWCRVASKYGASPRGQFVTEIYDSLGWAKYVAKHSARGVAHYQRSSENIPESWTKGTGRMWGFKGDWVIHTPMVFEFPSMRTYWRLRRLIRGWRVSDARASVAGAKDPKTAKQAVKRLGHARAMLSCSNKELSSIRGVSEWIRPGPVLDMLHHAAIDPEEITQTEG